jgi:hypothetical protein
VSTLEATRDRIELSNAVAILRGGVESPEYLEQSTHLYTYHSHFIPEGIAEVSQIFLRDADFTKIS